MAYKCYKNIHKLFPENVDCLKFLFRLANDLGLKEVHEYSQKLRKAEKMKEEKHEREDSGKNKKNNSRGNEVILVVINSY